MEVTEDAGDVERIASVLASTEVSTMDVGRDRVVGKARRGVRDVDGLEEEPSPPRGSIPDMVALGMRVGRSKTFA